MSDFQDYSEDELVDWDWDALDFGATDETEDEQLSDAGYDYDGELPLDELEPHERELYLSFYSANGGDEGQAVAAFAQYMENFERRFSDEAAEASAEDDEADHESWLRDSGLTADDWPEFEQTLDFVRENSDPETPFEDAANRALAVYRQTQDAVAQERSNMGIEHQHRSFDDAWAASKAEGLVGGKPAYVHQRGARDTDLDDAIGSFTEELSARNSVRRAARERVEAEQIIRAQETRGRG